MAGINFPQGEVFVTLRTICYSFVKPLPGPRGFLPFSQLPTRTRIPRVFSGPTAHRSVLYIAPEGKP